MHIIGNDEHDVGDDAAALLEVAEGGTYEESRAVRKTFHYINMQGRAGYACSPLETTSSTNDKLVGDNKLDVGDNTLDVGDSTRGRRGRVVGGCRVWADGLSNAWGTGP